MNVGAKRMESDPDSTGRETPALDQPVALVSFLNALLRNRWRIVAVIAMICLVAGAFVLLRPKRFISTASFSLQSDGSQRLSGLAAQFGLAMPSAQSQQSPAYYEELLESRDILSRVAAARYVDTVQGRAVPVTLAQAYDVQASSPALRSVELVDRLREAITVNTGRETGIVHVGLAAPTPVLAREILSTLLSRVAEFNIETRQSQAANERKFVEGRLQDTRVALRAAEDRLQDFLQRNRGGFMGVPALNFEHSRLQREVDLQQQLYASLAQNYEQAKLDEVRDTPALTIIEPPNTPVRRAPRGLLRALVIALVLGLVLSIGPLLLRVLVSTAPRSMDRELAEYDRLTAGMRFWPRNLVDRR